MWGGVTAMVPLALLLVSAMLWPQGPERLPSAWSGLMPSEFAAGGAVFSVAVSVAGVAAVLAAGASWLAALVAPAASRWLVAVLATVAAVGAAGYALLVLGAQLAGPENVIVLWPAAAVLLGLGWGWLALMAHGRTVPSLTDQLARIPERDRVQRQRGRRASIDPWSGSGASSSLRTGALFAVLVMTGCAVLLWSTGSRVAAPVVAALGVLIGLYAFAWSRIRIDIDAGGVRLSSAVLGGLRLARIPAARVIAVRSATLEPMTWGGHGLRPALGRTAYIGQGGPGLVIHRDDAFVWAVEVTEGDATLCARTLRLAAGQARACDPSGSEAAAPS